MRTACIAVLLATTCVAAAQGNDDTKIKEIPAFLHQLAETRKQIADGYISWTDALKTKNLEALLALYAEDATVLPDGNDAVSGKKAIRDFYAGWLAQPDKLVEQKFENINSFQEGDLLVDSTKFSGVVLRDGKEVSLRGKRLTVWQRSLQGKWKIVRDAWNKSSES